MNSNQNIQDRARQDKQEQPQQEQHGGGVQKDPKSGKPVETSPQKQTGFGTPPSGPAKGDQRSPKQENL